MNRVLFTALRVEYVAAPSITVSVDGINIMTSVNLPNHDSFRGRRLTLPVATSGYIGHLSSSSTSLLNYVFETVPVESFLEQQLFHYYEIGFRGTGTLRPQVYVDGDAKDTLYTVATKKENSTSEATETMRLYFDPISYGFVPHIHNIGDSAADSEILWAIPRALPPRFYRGIRTHAEFQITYRGSVELQWYLDGVAIDKVYNLTSTATKTEKLYFPSGTVGYVLQYRVLNPTAGKVFVVETDRTLSDLEQRTMSQQTEETR